jgi:hypothetical protein
LRLAEQADRSLYCAAGAPPPSCWPGFACVMLNEKTLSSHRICPEVNVVSLASTQAKYGSPAGMV